MLRPERALLSRISPGPRAWLRPLLRRSSGFVRRFHSYYHGARLLVSVHLRLRLLTFPKRTGAAQPARPDTRSPISHCSREGGGSDTILLYVMGSSTTAERRRHRIAAPHMLPSAPSTASASASFRLSRLYNPPHTIAVYASPQPSPADMQHSLTGARYGLPAPVFHRLDRASLPGALRARRARPAQALTLTCCAGLSLSRKR